MEEYKIITGTASDCQKWLNQWKHEYILNIISMNTVHVAGNNPLVTILLTRTKK